MKLPHPLVHGRFVARPNRFTCLVRIPGAGAPIRAHLPDPGRLRELLRPGARVWLEPKPGQHRKTGYQLWLVAQGQELVSLDTRLPNQLVREALDQGALPEFSQYASWEQERKIGASRLDFLLSGETGQCWLETKSVTLVEAGHALFPDAPTARGRRHLCELMRVRECGAQAVVCFVVQRADAHSVAANQRTDPEFAAALRKAHDCGVELLAYTCVVSPAEITLDRRIPVVVD